MQIPTFDVAVSGDGIDPDKAAETGDYDVHRVLVLGPDQMQAERMGKKLGLKVDGEGASLALSLTYLMVYLVLHRKGVLPGEWPAERGRLLSLEAVEPAATVDPTRPGPDTPSP